MLSFEQGPIRPPSEAQSLLIRFTRNCNWNQCLFCPVYKGRPFSRRPVDEVKRDIDAIAGIIEEVKAASWKMGYSGLINGNVAQDFFRRDLPQSALSVVAWLYCGTGAVFIQDANNLILQTEQLVELLLHLKEKIPGITRITSYARSQTAARKTAAELTEIKKAGLDRIHIGMESGSDQILKFMKKGVTGAAHVAAGQKIKAAGMELSEYWMPGLGGRALWRENALESARVLSAINPDFIRLRTLRVPEQIPLFEKVQSGEFELQGDDDNVSEIRLFLENLVGVTSYVASDHMMNLLQDVEGRLPRDKDFMLAALDRYLDLAPEQRLRYRLGRRMGLFHGAADMARLDLMGKVEEAYRDLEARYPGRMEQVLAELANRTI
ncbi:MAG: radical SAM protein [Pseudomonadota bacterium]